MNPQGLFVAALLALVSIHTTLSTPLPPLASVNDADHREATLFNLWAQKHHRASTLGNHHSEEHLNEGLDLVRRRNDLMVRLIQHHPEEAIKIAETLAEHVTHSLPNDVKAHIETHINGMSKFSIVANAPHNHQDLYGRNHPVRYAEIEVDGHTYVARKVPGNYKKLSHSKDGLAVRGVALNGYIALHHTPVERISFGSEGRPLARIGGDLMQFESLGHLDFHEEDVVANIHVLANTNKLPNFPYTEDWQAPKTYTGDLKMLVVRVDWSDEPASAELQDAENSIVPQFNLLQEWWNEASYGRSSLTMDVHPDIVRLDSNESILKYPADAPRSTAVDYGRGGFYFAHQWIVRDAQFKLEAAGHGDKVKCSTTWNEGIQYDCQYNFIVFVNDELCQYHMCTLVSRGLQGSVGNAWSWINGQFNAESLLKTLGHNMGFSNANFWEVPVGHVVYGRHGYGYEYGNFLDPMGSQLVPRSGMGGSACSIYAPRCDAEKLQPNGMRHYGTYWKELIGWLTKEEFHEHARLASGKYRIYAHDTNATLPEGGKRGLKVSGHRSCADAESCDFTYYFEFRANNQRVASLDNSITVTVAWTAQSKFAWRPNNHYSGDIAEEGSGNYLLDMNENTRQYEHMDQLLDVATSHSLVPSYIGTKDIETLVRGETFTEESLGMSFTPVEKGVTDGLQWMDVQVETVDLNSVRHCRGKMIRTQARGIISETNYSPGARCSWLLKPNEFEAGLVGEYFEVPIYPGRELIDLEGPGQPPSAILVTEFIGFLDSTEYQTRKRYFKEWVTWPEDVKPFERNEFQARFTGYIKVPLTGEYTFYLQSQDGSRLWIDNEIVIDHVYDGWDGIEELAETVELDSGFHRIRIEYYNTFYRPGVNCTDGRIDCDENHPTGLGLMFKGPGISKMLVPSTILFHHTAWRNDARFHYISLSFEDFNLEKNKDFISIYDGPNADAPLLARYTGSDTGPVIQSSSTEMYVVFEADPSTHGRREVSPSFSIYFESVEEHNTHCDGYSAHKGLTGLITETNYRNNARCIFFIEPNLGMGADFAIDHIRIELMSYDLELGYDWLRVLGDSNNEIKAVTGEGGGVFVEVESQERAVIEFSSDVAVPGYGFAIRWQAVPELEWCHGTRFFNEPSAKFRPGGLNDGNVYHYMPNMDCVWTIAPDEANYDFVELSLDGLDLSDKRDWLVIYDGPTAISPRLLAYRGIKDDEGRWCTVREEWQFDIKFDEDPEVTGDCPPKSCYACDWAPGETIKIRSTGPQMTIVFHTDDIGFGSGFHANYEAVKRPDEDYCAEAGYADCLLYDPNMTCKNLHWGYVCECRDGWYRNRHTDTCVRNEDDVNECEIGTPCCTVGKGCEVDAVCINDPYGSYVCMCPEGYRGNGVDDCHAIHPCEATVDDCLDHEVCDMVNNSTSHICTCEPGYKVTYEHDLDGNPILCQVDDPEWRCIHGIRVTCKDINECEPDSTARHMSCADHASCTNLPGSYECECYPGYYGDGSTCEAILTTHGCSCRGEWVHDGRVYHGCSITGDRDGQWCMVNEQGCFEDGRDWDFCPDRSENANSDAGGHGNGQIELLSARHHRAVSLADEVAALEGQMDSLPEVQHEQESIFSLPTMTLPLVGVAGAILLVWAVSVARRLRTHEEY